MPLGRVGRIVPYAGAGAGWYRYHEVCEGSDTLDTRHGGWLVAGGVDRVRPAGRGVPPDCRVRGNGVMTRARTAP